MQVKRHYKGFGSAGDSATGSKRFGHDEEYDRYHRKGRQLIDESIEFR
jgi:hypothetical protein